MWKTAGWTSGFKVTYTLPDDGSFIGWQEEETHMFGFDHQTSHYAEIELTNDLQQLEICVDYNQKHAHQTDFEGFKFLEFGSAKKKTLSAACPHNMF